MIFGVLATYLARESTRQRTEAIRSRRIELELAALEPFIETLDPEAKGTLRKELVKTYFGRAFDKESSDEDSIKLGGSALDFVKTIKGSLK